MDLAGTKDTAFHSFLSRSEELPVHPDHEDRFTVYVRFDTSHVQRPEDMEKALASFPDFERAHRFQLAWQRRKPFPCVIRFNGATGGGD